VVLAIFLSLISCSKNDPNPVPPTPPVVIPSSFAKGADISWVTEMEASGKKFYNSAGAQQDIFEILKNLGMNTIRLRVWVNPIDGWNNKADVIAKAARAKDAGMRIMIDFHYSDTWADPGHQSKPLAWVSMDMNGLKTSITNHTVDVLNGLRNAGITPEWVQVGNETNDGMLWPDGKASINMANFAQLINAGYDAVKSVFPSAKVVVHVSNGWDNSLFKWLFDG
jgi:arabinogalactan endo-1,4-beta-galactosidase